MNRLWKTLFLFVAVAVVTVPAMAVVGNTGPPPIDETASLNFITTLTEADEGVGWVNTYGNEVNVATQACPSCHAVPAVMPTVLEIEPIKMAGNTYDGTLLDRDGPGPFVTVATEYDGNEQALILTESTVPEPAPTHLVPLR